MQPTRQVRCCGSHAYVSPKETTHEPVSGQHLIETDSSRWPIVLHRTIGTPSDEAIDVLIARADAFLARCEPHVVIFDNEHAGMPSRYMRRKNMEWLDTHRVALSQYCVGLAFVFPSAAMRTVMSTALLVWSQPVEYDVFADVPSAEQWAKKRLSATENGRSAPQ